MNIAQNSTGQGVEYRQIDATQAGQRLDNFLISKLKGVPRSHIYRILRKGQVRINSGRRAADYRLRAGDVVRIPPLRMAPADRPRAAAADGPLELCILYEDAHLMAVDKPAGLAVHGGSGVSLGLIEHLRSQRPRARFLELAHRLDRDTSGCLLLAKRRSALLGLHAQLREARVKKRYSALVQGRWDDEARHVELPLAKYRLRSGERMVEVSQGGKQAVTRFIAKQRFVDCTLVEIELLTGRTHQVRVHAAYLGHPVAGDRKYGDREFNQRMARLGLKRLFLHAGAVGFKHPHTGSRMVLKAPLPAEFTDLLDCLKHEAPL